MHGNAVTQVRLLNLAPAADVAAVKQAAKTETPGKQATAKSHNLQRTLTLTDVYQVHDQSMQLPNRCT